MIGGLALKSIGVAMGITGHNKSCPVPNQPAMPTGSVRVASAVGWIARKTKHMFIETYVLDDMEHSGGKDQLPQCIDCFKTKNESWPAQVVALLTERDANGQFIGVFLCWNHLQQREKEGQA